jgi:D-beta-D-heptose 7-phosphate kinase/D-beta-D-heptose 1-phosphate adenosyltransferase
MLAAMGCVGYVTVFDDDTPRPLLRRLQPDVLVKGGTYKPEEVVGHEIVTAYGGRVALCGVVEGISTTNIVESLAKQHVPSPHFATNAPHPRPLSPADRGEGR